MFRRPRPPQEEYIRLQSWNDRHANGMYELESEYDEALDQAERLEEAYGLPSSVLVIGCRMGYEVRAFASYFPTSIITGIDIVPAFIEHAKLRATQNVLVADMHDLPFHDRSFEWVYSTGTLEHAYDPKRVIDEMCRVATRLIYVTADIVEELRNTSHFAFSTEPQEWLDLFPSSWKVNSRVDHVRVHMEAQPWTPTP